jgi:hypothetical protein
MLAGRNSIAAIERFARDAPPVVLEAVDARKVTGPFGNRLVSPGYDTFQQLLGEVAPEDAAVLAASARELAFAPDHQIRIDGKRLRGRPRGR